MLSGSDGRERPKEKGKQLASHGECLEEDPGGSLADIHHFGSSCLT